jgi:hypothetical protein
MSTTIRKALAGSRWSRGKILWANDLHYLQFGLNVFGVNVSGPIPLDPK